MKHIEGINQHIIVYVIMLTISGCAYPKVNVDNMIPQITPITNYGQNKTLNIENVTGGQDSSFSLNELEVINIDNSSYKEALLKSLGNSKMFDIIDERYGDFGLKAEIASVNINVVGWRSFSSQILVNYYLKDNKSNNIVWQDHIYTECTEEGAYFKSKECAARNNIFELVSKLSTFIRNR